MNTRTMNRESYQYQRVANGYDHSSAWQPTMPASTSGQPATVSGLPGALSRLPAPASDLPASTSGQPTSMSGQQVSQRIPEQMARVASQRQICQIPSRPYPDPYRVNGYAAQQTLHRQPQRQQPQRQQYSVSDSVAPGSPGLTHGSPGSSGALDAPGASVAPVAPGSPELSGSPCVENVYHQPAPLPVSHSEGGNVLMNSGLIGSGPRFETGNEAGCEAGCEAGYESNPGSDVGIEPVSGMKLMPSREEWMHIITAIVQKEIDPKRVILAYDILCGACYPFAMLLGILHQPTPAPQSTVPPSSSTSQKEAGDVLAPNDPNDHNDPNASDDPNDPNASIDLNDPIPLSDYLTVTEVAILTRRNPQSIRRMINCKYLPAVKLHPGMRSPWMIQRHIAKQFVKGISFDEVKELEQLQQPEQQKPLEQKDESATASEKIDDVSHNGQSSNI